ncbi:tetratricopeptide repeat protein [Niabella ginsengisoli]|uniref:Tetratricopeptide repeat protein n=1 Tax=Niabella ginsengisoli TaxID=522298 RepID=A0ABS9SQ68_9BACT|nr:tetratricopeptide repeat protein [Niabella ginsengisoli]MCH5600497.1 tetratricopeptide repeat protein [Niabella ginsengisoli]
MKKPQYLTIFISLGVLCILWAFGKTKPDVTQASHDGHQHEQNTSHSNSTTLTSSFSIDSVLSIEKGKLAPQNISTLGQIESSVEKSNGSEQKLHAYHQLSQFWKEQGKAFIPYAWYVAEGARLENSEKNLNFAGHLFLNNLQNVENEELVRWMGLQAKDLFERSLKLNSDNDSAKVGLGATYMFGGISNAPMEGISKIREVVAKDSTNLYAQMTLAMGSLMSGQTEKARERLETITRLDPKNLQAMLLLADIYEKQDKKQDAIKYYQKALPLVNAHAEMKTELEKELML